MLWLHGFMGSSKDWHPLIHEHFMDYCNILIDLPGHANSTVSENLTYLSLLEQLAQQLSSNGFKSLVLIGYSMGGRIALHLQQRYPQQFSALIGLSTAPGLRTKQERLDRKRSDDALMDRFKRMESAAFLKTWYEQALFQLIQQDDALLSRLIRSRSTQNPDQLRRSLNLFGNGALPSLWNKLKEIHIPVLLISGAEDSKYCRINHEMNQLLPKAQHQVIAESDHAFFLEKSLETARLIKQFLSETIEGELRVRY